MPDVVIEPFAPRDRAAVFALYRRVMTFPPASDLDAYWTWRFERNPFDDGRRPTFWVARQGGEVVGGLAQLPVMVDVGGRPRAASWAGDFMVDPRHRGGGLGRRLFRHYREANDFVLSMGPAPDSATGRIGRAVGFRALPPLPYLFKFYGLTPLLGRSRGGRGIPRGVNAVARGVLRRVAFLGDHRPAGVRLDDITRFDASFDALWRRVSAESAVAVRRTHQSMNWRYVENPFHRYRVVGAWDGDMLRGCLVLKVASAGRFAYGTLAELVAPRDDRAVARALLRRALEHFEAAGVEVVKTLSSAPHLVRLLRSAGFFPLGKGCDVLFAVRDEAPGDTEALAPAGWYLGKGDSDCDVVPDFMSAATTVPAVAQV